MKRSSTIFAFFLLSLVLCGGCAEERAPSGLRQTRIRLGSRTFELEIANHTLTRERGLMDRSSMPTGHGMLFVFDDGDKVRTFWMKDTLIPLDIVFVDGAGKVVSIHQMKPLDLSTTSSDQPALYAIELNQGEAEAAGVHVGDLVQIPQSVGQSSDYTEDSGR